MEPREHFHIVEFIDGCLNDYCSSAIDTIEEARNEFSWQLQYNTTANWKPDGEDRYTGGVHILEIEDCNNDDCYDENGDAVEIW